MTPTKFLLAVALTALAGNLQAATIEVPRDHATLAEALAASRTGDIVELAPGIYPTNGVTLTRGVTIRGLGGDARSVVLDGGDSGRIMTIEFLPEAVWILNLTFRGGFALGESVNLMSGGALFINQANVSLQNCRFENNRAAAHGGALRAVESFLHISQCDFVGNRAQQGGGAVDVADESSPTFVRCLFRDNTAMWGGAVSCRGGVTPLFMGVDFVGNRATGMLAYGGAVYADFDAAPGFEDCTFNANEARLGGALACFQGSNVSVARSTLVNNIGTETGAGLFCLDGQPQVTSSLIAFQDGTGITSEAQGRPRVDCTGVWANSGGDVVGAVDGAGSLVSSDPDFCGSGGVDGAFYPLAPDSPFAPDVSGCGRVGAWPVTCTADAPDLLGLETTWTGSQLRVDWQTAGDPAHDRYRLTWENHGREHEIPLLHLGDGRYTAFVNLSPADAAGATLQLYARGPSQAWAPLLDDRVGTDEPGDDDPPPAPESVRVRNWPNPFNPATTIAFDLPREQHVRVTIYATDGRLVRVLHEGVTRAGTTELPWSGRDERGRAVASGVYFVRVAARDALRTHKVTLVR